MRIFFLLVILFLVSTGYKIDRSFQNDHFDDDDDLQPINLDQQGHFEGDLIVPEPKLRNAILSSRQWPNGIVYYSIDSCYPAKKILLILKAMHSIQNYTCIRFIPRASESDYISITNTSDGCYSEGVGRMGGKQIVSLMLGSNITCFTRAIVTHELLHAIGLWHEHMRYDRDDHVIIHRENAREGAAEQFDVIPTSQSSTYDLPYDYLSVMHYSAYAFSGNGSVTIEPKNKAYLDTIGTALDPSVNDWEKLRRIYKCGTETTAETEEEDEIEEEIESCEDQLSNCEFFQMECGRYKWVSTMCPLTCGKCLLVR